MAYDKEVAAQVLKNIRLIEETHKVVDDVTDTISKAIDKKVRELVSVELEGYCEEASQFDLTDNGELWFTTEEWQDPEDKSESKAWYGLSIYGDDSNFFWLTEYLGEGQIPEANLKLRFDYNESVFEQKKQGRKKTLKAFFEETPELAKAGFSISADQVGIELGFSLEKDVVAEEYPKFSVALEPLETALGVMFKHHHLFKKLIEELERK